MAMIRLFFSLSLILSFVHAQSTTSNTNASTTPSSPPTSPPTSSSPCFKKTIGSIPHDHLLYKKTKPLVIGHRGNPMKYQENTLEGFLSLLDTNADGFEVDVQLTKDDKLVAFRDDNTQFLTGVNGKVGEMKETDLAKLTINDSLTYGPNTYKFSRRRPIPLLIDLLQRMKDKGKIMFLDIKPNHANSFNASYKAGRLVAQMVKGLGLVNQAAITSFDPIKVRAAHQENPDIPTGMLFMSPKWDEKKCKIKPLKMLTCPTGTDATKCQSFIHKTFESGDVLKAVNASFLDMNYTIYLTANDTLEILRKNYSPNISAGAWGMYSMALGKNSPEALKQDAKIDRLMKMGVERFITDDVYRLLRKLGRPQWQSTVGPAITTKSANTTAHPVSSSVREIPHISCSMMAFFFLMYGTVYF